MQRSRDNRVLVLNSRPLWVRLLFRALGRFVPTAGVVFRLTANDTPISEFELGEASGWELHSVRLPRRSFGRMAPVFAPWIGKRLQRDFGSPSVMVITDPSQRALCRYFEGAYRVYYVADDYRWGYGWNPQSVETWEKIIIGNVEKVVCVSNALAKSLQSRLEVKQERIYVSASGMPENMIPEKPSPFIGIAQRDIFPDRRPLAGVLGTIDSRIRLDWLRQLVDMLPWLNLLLVGPLAKLEDGQLADWHYLKEHPRCLVAGEVQYHELFRYAAAVDVGLIPLTDQGINPTSSPTRFFTQLPFGQPIVASDGSLQLSDFQPLVWITRTVHDFIQKVEDLQRADFKDGMAAQRHAAAYEHTWERRAENFYRELVAG